MLLRPLTVFAPLPWLSTVAHLMLATRKINFELSCTCGPRGAARVHKAARGDIIWTVRGVSGGGAPTTGMSGYRVTSNYICVCMNNSLGTWFVIHSPCMHQNEEKINTNTNNIYSNHVRRYTIKQNILLGFITFIDSSFSEHWKCCRLISLRQQPRPRPVLALSLSAYSGAGESNKEIM